MTAPTELLSASAVQALGWTLLHFVWQGAATALLLAFLLWLTRASSPAVRYLLSCASLALMILLPVFTYAVLAPIQAIPDVTYNLNPSPAWETGTTTAAGTHQTPAEPSSSKRSSRSWLEPSFPYLVATWFLGVLLLSVRLLGGLWLLRKLKTRFNKPVPEVLSLKCRELARRLGVTRSVRIRESLAASIPLVIGWLRPVILLPTSALSRLSVPQLELILVHELAHIRRGVASVWWTGRSLPFQRVSWLSKVGFLNRFSTLSFLQNGS